MTQATAALGRLGRYELLSRLGVGGMGEVFLARSTGSAGFEKEVVIKRILPQLADNPIFVRRFVEEGKLVVRLRHAGIAQVFDLGDEAGVPYLVMEHVDGRDLRDLLRLGRVFSLEPSTAVVTEILIQVLEALDHAHGCTGDDGQPLGIIHRDVSPANVMLSRTGQVKLVDFGIARATESLGLSMPGVVQGKYAYMSPEQAAGEELDARSDLFSVGVLAWEMLTGERPFDAETDLKTLDRIRTTTPPPLSTALPQAPPEVCSVVDRLLARDPDARFAQASDAARGLRAYLYREGAMVGARDIASWVAQILERLGATSEGDALSLDDALRLPPGQHAEDGTKSGTRTLSVPSATPTGTPGGWGRGTLPSLPDTIRPPTAPSRARLGLLGSFLAPRTLPPTIGPARRRGRLVTLLVALNVLMLAAVGLLVWDQADTRMATMDTVPESAEPSTGSPPLLAEEPPPSEPPEAAPGEAAQAPTLPPSQPAGSPRAAEPAQPRAKPSGQRAERPPEPISMGTVKFRFHPASSKVLIDGRPVPTGEGNILSLELPARSHRLTVIAPGGSRRQVPFVVRTGKTTNLATIDVDEGPGAD